MEIINYDDLYENAVIDFSNKIGLKLTDNYSKKYNLSDFLPENDSPDIDQTIVEKNIPTPPKQQTVQNTQVVKEDYSKFKGYEQFNRAYDKVQAYNPDAIKYRSLLTKIASIESGFRVGVVNKIGAAGYFQFIDSTRNGIMKKIGKSTNKQTFLNNPELQILAAIELAKEFENSFSSDYLKLASQKGHSINGLISGAWLGGVGGVKRYLKTGRDSSDGGTTVSKRIKIGDQV